MRTPRPIVAAILSRGWTEVHETRCCTNPAPSGRSSSYVDDSNVRPSDHIPLTVVFKLN
jgi:hypothetical protein